ncbi:MULTISPECIES: AAA family ATPase [Spirulina sp. CCY15215]|uniref:AAA family ATPase n=1 Tax=Spirulina sp. CCY15215 TaxID=2767591 RepID=UPI001950EE26|nr:AAA family ATPase [Spirulina major]
MSQNTLSENNSIIAEKGITKVTIQGFKSLYDECSIEIAPLTILAGANSSGKSSIMQPLLLMKQTLEAPYNPGVFLLNGPHVKFTLEEQLFSYSELGDRERSFSVNLERLNWNLRTVYEKPTKGKIEIVESTHIFGDQKVRFRQNMTKAEIINMLSFYHPDDYEILFKDSIPISLEYKKNLQWSITNKRCFLELFVESYANLYERRIFYHSESIIPWIESPILQILHLPGLRGNPERSYPTTAIGQDFQGTFEKYAASIISYWQQTQDDRLGKLRENLQKLGLTWTVEATQLNDVQVELQVGLMPNKTATSQTVNIADVGIGVSQVLPVLVALLVAETGQLVYLEQPELHLHPRAQVALGEILADAAKRGVKVVLETHSALLLRAIQTLVAEETLNPDLVKLHWFTRQEDGRTTINSVNLDETGAYGDWPEDFGDISMQLNHRYLTAAETKLFERIK